MDTFQKSNISSRINKYTNIYSDSPKPVLSIENIRKYYVFPNADVSFLRRTINSCGIKRWPYKKLTTINNIIEYDNKNEKSEAILGKKLLMKNRNIPLFNLFPKSKLDKINIKIALIKKNACAKVTPEPPIKTIKKEYRHNSNSNTNSDTTHSQFSKKIQILKTAAYQCESECDLIKTQFIRNMEMLKTAAYQCNHEHE